MVEQCMYKLGSELAHAFCMSMHRAQITIATTAGLRAHDFLALSDFKLDVRYAGSFPRASDVHPSENSRFMLPARERHLRSQSKAFSAPLVISLADNGLDGLLTVDSISCSQ